MRKIVLIIVIAFAISCSGRNPNRIMVWHSMRPLETDILREALAEFGQRYSAWEFSELFYANETARINYIISALGGSGPDLFWGASDNIGPFVELGVIAPIEPYVNQAYLDSFITEPFPANTWFRGHLYQVGDRVGNHLCLVYNKKMIPSPPQTMSDLLRIGKQLAKDTDGDGKPDVYALAWNYTEPFFAVPFIGGYGGWIMDENNRPTLNTRAVVKAQQLIYDLGNKYKIIPAECDYEIANALFIDGYSAMIINGAWSWGTYIKNGIDIGIARIPKVDETGLWPTPAASPLGYSLNVNLKGEKLKVAMALLQFLTSPEVELRFAATGANIPSRREALRNPIVTNNKMIRDSLDQLQVAKMMPVVTELRWIWDAMRPSYQGIFTGLTTPKKAAKEMQELAEKLIKENRG